jgi:hypothetical protein
MYYYTFPEALAREKYWYPGHEAFVDEDIAGNE